MELLEVSESVPRKPVIASVADPMVMRIIPELATEIGLNESIALLQISFWIKTTNNLRDGQYWTYQSIRDMKEKAFKFWSIATINRVVRSLESKGLIRIGNYNQREKDNTRWITLNTVGIETLQSVHISWLEGEKEPSQNETTRFKMKQVDGKLFQNETGPFQNETTLPESPEITKTENRTENKDLALTSAKPKQSRKRKETRPAELFNPLKDAIVLAFGWNIDDVPKGKWGQINKAAADLYDVGVTPAEVPALHTYCKKNHTRFGPNALPGAVPDVRKAKRVLYIPPVEPEYIPPDLTAQYYNYAGVTNG